MGVGDSCRLAAVNFGFELRAACELELHTVLAHVLAIVHSIKKNL
jgi:hypothetical protein